MHPASAPALPALLPAKMNPPAADPAQVLRVAVCDKVCEASTARLVLIRAPAGFGKTTAMRQCRVRLEAEGVATAWLTLDAADNDPTRFLHFLGALVNQLRPERLGTGEHADASEISELPLDLLDQLGTIRGNFVLFLDDFELIQDHGVLALVREMIERLPAGARVVIGSRTTPNFRLGRLRARGQLMEIDMQQLRFSSDETARFFAQRKALGLAAAQLETLHRKTEGWAAALWLAWLALERADEPAAFITRFSGADAGLADYLAEEVLAQQPDAIRRFLLRTSILRELQPALCQALAPESESAATLRHLEAASMFLIATPVREGAEPIWRYHSLFAGFLRAQLQRELPHEIPALHHAAAAWYEAQARPVPAIEHLIESGDTAQAIALLRREAPQLLEHGRLRWLTRWLGALPSAALREAPLLQAVQVWATCYTRGPREALDLLRSTGLQQSNDAQLRPYLVALHPVLLMLMDRTEEAYAEGQRGMLSLPSDSSFADAVLVNAVATCATTLGRYDEARRLLDAVRRTQNQGTSAFLRMYAETIEGIFDLLEGRLRQATARFHLAVNTTQPDAFGSSYGNARAGLFHAISIYESNDLQQAARLLHVYLPLARDIWSSDRIILGHAMLARIAFAQGDVDDAFETLAELEYLGDQRDMRRLVASARLERARLQLLQGYAEAARVELDRADEPGLWEGIAGRRHLAHDLEDLAIGRARWELFAGDARRAAQWLEAEAATAQAQSRGRRALRLQFMHALALTRSGKHAAAQALALTVLRQTCKEGALRLILDEGPLAGALVRQVLEQFGTRRAEPVFAAYLQRLLQAFGPLAPDLGEHDSAPAIAQTLDEPLTHKELRTLQLLAEGYSNDAIAEKLFVSNSTVRTHLRNINAKFGAHTRTQAVTIARRLGLIR
ncbi:MAG: LuxR C-terminal-related transcriptional regulator [Sulfuricaulis sp.]|nr:LuxR C-terminal-related transcriptional regulator [Sulfuricaulis sp.]